MRLLALCLCVWLLPALGAAQQDGGGAALVGPLATPGAETAGGQVVRSPILTIDPERLFARSEYGQRVAAELREATEALATENRRIEAALTEEEQSLTERRPEMEVEAFRAEAEAFDEKVQQIRREQDAKERELQLVVQRGQEEFREVARPILGEMMIERGAAVILDQRSVFLGIGVIDITDEAVERIDAEIGAGTSAVGP